jgi:sarcosine oxidase subunit beta
MISEALADAEAPLPESAEVAIVGAGIMGLAVAYNLAKNYGIREIVVIDQTYLCGGASGRNGGGVRAQWSNEANIQLMQQSLELCREFAREHRINTWFRQGGYLFLARDDQTAAKLAEGVRVQNACGVRTELLDSNQLRRVVPELSAEGVVAASYNPDDAVVFPWPFVWGYAEGARALGVRIRTFARAIGIETEGRRVAALVTDKGSIKTRIIVNAAGALSPEIAVMVGLDLPTHPHRHEICSTEPLKPWLKPLVADLSNGLYFSQSTRGELVGGIGNPRVPAGPDQNSSYRFLALYSRALLRCCPPLGAVKILRQWAGLYDISADGNPIVGAVDEIEGFYLVSGFMGHGFMMAPVVGRLLAQLIAMRDAPPIFERWNLRRFKQGRLLDEDLTIG